MKVLLVVHYFLPHIGGMEAVVEKQAKSLVQRGHEVTILTCSPGKGLPATEQHNGYTIQRLPALNFVEKRFGVTYPIISPHHLFWLFRHVALYDVVHIHDVFYMSSHLAALSCMLRRKAFFLTQHVAMVDYPSVFVMAVQRVMYGFFGRLMFARAAKVICYNHIVRSFLIANRVPRSKIFMQYNGIDTSYFSPIGEGQKQSLRKKYALPLDRPIALFVGRLVPKKGYDLVYRAHASGYFTLIVGDGKPAADMTPHDDVRMFGPASPAQLRDLYRASDVFIFPAMGEIFTLVMQEAMSSGLPVVTADDPGYQSYTFSRELIQLVGRDSELIKDVLGKTLENKEKIREMSEYSRNFALEHFDWERNYTHEYELYHAVANEMVASDA
jgi:D-inositol-3-phosphate glycosyltransferase